MGPPLGEGAGALLAAETCTSALLAEALRGKACVLALQAPAGTTMAVVPGVARAAKGRGPAASDVSGMAFHKVADEHWTALPMPPQDDPERRVLFPPSTAATLNLTAKIGRAHV